MMETVIANARLRRSSGVWHIGVRDGRIREVSRHPIPGRQVIHAEGALLTPGLVETHLHLEKALTADRISWNEERPTGREYRRFQEQITASLKRGYTHDDIVQRALQVARMASAAGTTTMRAQCEVDEALQLKAIEALLEVRERVKPFLTLQIIAFPPGDIMGAPDVVGLVRRAMEVGADGIGGLPELYPENVEPYLDLIFRTAADYGGVVDLHVDQPRDERLFSFPFMVAKARQYGLEGKVTGAHSNSLAFQPRDRVLPVLEQMRETGVHLACLPYGFVEERIKVPKAMGIAVSLINDNVRDPWQRGGSADLVQIAMIYARTSAVRSDGGLEAAFDMISEDGARSLGLSDYGIHEGAQADLVLFRAESVQHVICHHIRPTLVFKAGRVVAQEGRCLL